MGAFEEIVDKIEGQDIFQMPAKHKLAMYVTATAAAWGAQQLTYKMYPKILKIYQLKKSV